MTGTWVEQADGQTGEFWLEGKYGQIGQGSADEKKQKRVVKPRGIGNVMGGAEKMAHSEVVGDYVGNLQLSPVSAELFETEETKRLPNLNPYCIIKLGKSTCKTRCCDNGGYAPVWKDTLDFKVDGDTQMWFKVFSSDNYAGDELLSENVIMLDDILKSVKGEKSFGLEKYGKKVGSVKIWFAYEHVSGKMVL